MVRKSSKNQIDRETVVYKTAIYARISKENPEQEKIETQIQQVKKYIENKSFFELVDVYADNGYSGVNFNRPEFQRMMEDLRNHKIGIVIFL